jgi:hypothetical protein
MHDPSTRNENRRLRIAAREARADLARQVHLSRELLKAVRAQRAAEASESLP